MYKVKDKGKSQAGGLGTGCNSQGQEAIEALIVGPEIMPIIGSKIHVNAQTKILALQK